MKAWQGQQGDVTFERVVQVPAGVRIEKDAEKVLARGEATGHAHRLTDTSDGMLYEVGGQLYLSVGDGSATVVHEEHGPVVLEPGEYRVGRVREWDYFAEEAREIRD